mgnify:CR=1 FL=1
MIEKERIKYLNDKKLQNKKYIVYWMQQSQRAEYNHALEYAIFLSNKYKKPLIVFFCLTTNFLDANIRHYKFMIEGLKEVKKNLEDRGIRFVFKEISPEKGAIDISKDASIMVVDRGYLKIQRNWRKHVSDEIKCPLIQIEGDVVVPIEDASEKEEYSARTIRNKIQKKLGKYLVPIKKQNYTNGYIEDFDSNNLNEINFDGVDKSVKPSADFTGGTINAKKHLNIFIKEKLDSFLDKRNDPSLDFVSDMSPYLHFGQISPVYIANKINSSNSPGKESYLEELIIRRELSMNFVFYNKNYDSIKGISDWAKNTLKKHKKDKREYIYSLEEIENYETHDPYWNAAQKEMVKTGKMHGYMRMYWGKKIIEWTKNPKDAFHIAIYLNNKYELDGRDPNGYTGVAWCFGKHDRAWKERSIFGKVRYMNDKGLKRKFDIEKYVKKIK